MKLENEVTRVLTSTKFNDTLADNKQRIRELVLDQLRMPEIPEVSFWAMQLSSAAKAVTHSKLDDLSTNILWLEAVRLKFNRVSE